LGTLDFLKVETFPVGLVSYRHKRKNGKGVKTMKSYRDWIVPTVTSAVIGGCWGLLQYLYFGPYGSQGLISSAQALATYPLWTMPENLRTLGCLLHLLLGIAAVSLSLWTWSRLLGPQLRKALEQGTSRTGVRGFIVKSVLWTGLNLSLVYLYRSAPTSYWQGSISPLCQLGGLLSFVPTVWAISRQRELLELIAQPDELTGRQVGLSLALASPLVVSPVVWQAITPGLGRGLWVHHVAANAFGPWPLTFTSALWMGIAGLALALLVRVFETGQCRPKMALRLLTLSAGLGAAAMLVPAAEQPASGPKTIGYTLVALDTKLPCIQVPVLSTLPTNPKEQVRQSLLTDWNADQALKILSTSNQAWFDLSSGVLQHLANCRPADLQPQLDVQTRVLATGVDLKDGQLASVDHSAEVQRFRKRTDSQGNASIQGQISQDGRPLANVAFRLQHSFTTSQDFSAQVECTMRGEKQICSSDHYCLDWHLGEALSTFYAQGRTDARGNFQMDGLEAGAYEVVLRLEGARSLRAVQAPGVINLSPGQHLELAPILVGP
jgi:hypothetical protein